MISVAFIKLSVVNVLNSKFNLFGFYYIFGFQSLLAYSNPLFTCIRKCPIHIYAMYLYVPYAAAQKHIEILHSKIEVLFDFFC